jgi:hypothetical protein
MNNFHVVRKFVTFSLFSMFVKYFTNDMICFPCIKRDRFSCPRKLARPCRKKRRWKCFFLNTNIDNELVAFNATQVLRFLVVIMSTSFFLSSVSILLAACRISSSLSSTVNTLWSSKLLMWRYLEIMSQIYIQTKKQTPWPLVRERTIPTERPPLVDEI